MMPSKRYFPIIVLCIALCFSSEVRSQGTLSDSLVLRNPTGGLTTLIPNPSVPPLSPWFLTLPPTAGTSNAMLVSTVTGSNAVLSWLAPGPDNTVLTMTSGTPQWVAGANWLLTGNTAVNEATQFLGTTDANDLVIRSNNLIRMRVNQEFNQGVDVSRPTTTDGAYTIMNLGMNMQNAGGYAIAQDNTRVLMNSVDFGSGGPGGPAQTGTFFSNWTRLWMQRAPGTTYNDLVGYYFHWQANNAATINTMTGFWSERRSGSTNNTVNTLYQFRAEMPGGGTVNNLFGFHMGTPGGTLSNVAAFNADNIPTGTGNRYAFRYNASGSNQPFAVQSDGTLTSGTLTPLSGSRILVTNVAATGARALDLDMTGTTTSSGLVVRNVGATGSNDAGILIGTAATGTGTAMRISGVAGFNAPNTGIDMTFSTTGISATPRSTGAGTGLSVGTSSGNRTRIGAELYSRASGTEAYGLLADVNATAGGGSLGIGAYLTTTGATGDLFPLVVASQNNAAVYLGSTIADRPAPLATVLGPMTTLNTTFMFNTRVSGTATFVGTTSGTVGIAAPAVATPHEYRLPATQGVIGSALRIQSLAGSTAQLEWTADPVAPAPLFARRTADGVYATSVLANDAQLFLALAANVVYEFEAVIAYDGATSDAALQIGFTTPAGASLRWGIVGGNGVSVSPSSVAASGVAIADIPVNTSVPGNDVMVIVRGLVVMGPTAGNLQLTAAATTAGTTVTILTNSFIKATRMN